MLNIVALMGRLTTEPELKKTISGVSMCKFTLAVERNFAKQGGERETDFINCLAWRNTAEFISKYFVKGQLIAVDGSIQTGSYTDNNGNKRHTFDVVVANANFTGDKRNGGNNKENDGYSCPDIPPDDDLPF